MKITKKKIKDLYAIYEEMNPLIDEASELLKRAKLNKDKKIKVKRDGKTVEVKEGDLWTEIFYKANTDARETLKGIYPEVFEKSEQAEAKKDEMIKYSVAELGIHPEQMTLYNLIRLVEGIIEYKK